LYWCFFAICDGDGDGDHFYSAPAGDSTGDSTGRDNKNIALPLATPAGNTLVRVGVDRVLCLSPAAPLLDRHLFTLFPVLCVSLRGVVVFVVMLPLLVIVTQTTCSRVPSHASGNGWESGRRMLMRWRCVHPGTLILDVHEVRTQQ
jgi:hypothetical protein